MLIYIFSVYTGCSIYEKRADNLLEEVLNRIEKFDFYKFGNFLCGLCCGILYLIRNSMVEGCEDDILGGVDKQLNVFYSNSNFKDLEKLNLDGWIHYLCMRVQSDKGVDSIKIANLNLLNHLLNINSDEISLF